MNQIDLTKAVKTFLEDTVLEPILGRSANEITWPKTVRYIGPDSWIVDLKIEGDPYRLYGADYISPGSEIQEYEDHCKDSGIDPGSVKPVENIKMAQSPIYYADPRQAWRFVPKRKPFLGGGPVTAHTYRQTPFEYAPIFLDSFVLFQISR